MELGQGREVGSPAGRAGKKDAKLASISRRGVNKASEEHCRIANPSFEGAALRDGKGVGRLSFLSTGSAWSRRKGGRLGTCCRS